MKILMVSPGYFPQIGGVEKHVQEISERLVKIKEEVTVLCVDSSLKEIKKEIINGVKVIRCPGFSPKGNYHISFELYRKIKELNYDILHCHSYNSATSIMAILANKKKGKCILTFHSSGMGLWINNIIHIPYTLLMFFLKSKIDQFIFVSPFEKENFVNKLSIPSEKTIIIPNGLDFNEFKELRKIKPNKDLIISIGRLEKYKGFQNVIRGFAEAYKENNNLRLEILGKGDYEQDLWNLIKRLNLEGIININYLERKEMLKHLAKAGTFILLSKYESNGISVLEAIALKKKIILTYKTALKEFVDENYALGIKNVQDIQEIKEKLLKKITFANKKIDSWDEITKQIKKVYKGFKR